MQTKNNPQSFDDAFAKGKAMGELAKIMNIDPDMLRALGQSMYPNQTGAGDAGPDDGGEFTIDDFDRRGDVDTSSSATGAVLGEPDKNRNGCDRVGPRDVMLNIDQLDGIEVELSRQFIKCKDGGNSQRYEFTSQVRFTNAPTMPTYVLKGDISPTGALNPSAVWRKYRGDMGGSSNKMFNAMWHDFSEQTAQVMMTARRGVSTELTSDAVKAFLYGIKNYFFNAEQVGSVLEKCFLMADNPEHQPENSTAQVVFAELSIAEDNGSAGIGVGESFTHLDFMDSYQNYLDSTEEQLLTLQVAELYDSGNGFDTASIVGVNNIGQRIKLALTEDAYTELDNVEPTPVGQTFVFTLQGELKEVV